MHPASIDQPGHARGARLYPGRSITTIVRDDVYPATIRRAYIVADADTFFSVPARVSIGGRKVAGFVSAQSLEGSAIATLEDPAVYTFTPYRY